jgi:TRAP-type transport system small permease protein
MHRVERIRSCLSASVNTACGLLIVAITCLVFFQVIARYILAYATPWAEELLRLLFVWLIMLAACNSKHLRLDLFEHGKVRGGRLIGAVGNTVCLIVLLVLGYGTLDMIELTAYDRYSSLDLSVQWAFYGVGIGILLWLLRVILDFVIGAAGGSGENR